MVKTCCSEYQVLTFRAFLAASASERLSKLTNPTGYEKKKKDMSGDGETVTSFGSGSIAFSLQIQCDTPVPADTAVAFLLAVPLP